MNTSLRAGVPALFAALFDDAAMFPPGNAELPDAARRHHDLQRLWYAGAVGPLLCPESRLLELHRALEAAGIDRLDVGLTVPGGPRTLGPALDTARQAWRVRVVAVELPLGSAAPSSVRQELDAYDAGIAGFAEIPPHELDADVADRLRAAGLQAKFRTGGTTAAAFPSEDDLARALTAGVARGLPFKCTAGLHRAVRHRDPVTGFEQHGFLNVLLAVGAALTTADARATRAALAERDRTTVASGVRALTPAQVPVIRGAFRSFGTCSIEEPLADLADLGLLGVTR